VTHRKTLHGFFKNRGPMDDRLSSSGYLRIVNESGEDYAYSADRFFRLEVPQPLERAC
jgi:hypothetical protein